jgi:Transposase DDE domain group 1
MQTDCCADLFGFAPVEGREVVAAFDGGAMISDAGALLLGAADRAIKLVERFAECFHDVRRPELIEHEVVTLVGQRVFGIALGYEDLNDHDELRHDPVMAVLAGKLEARREDCAPVAGKSTLNRLELSRLEATRYHKISHNPIAIKRLMVDVFLEAHQRAPRAIVLDLDATDDPVHGEQEGRFFNAYYDCYCYLPLYVFCGRHFLASKLRPASLDAAAGAVEEVARIVAQIRRRWPDVRILLRADSGFAREELMAWCEANGVHFLFGLQQNKRLIAAIAGVLTRGEAKSRQTGKPARFFKEFTYRTRRSWSRRRRVVGKAEFTKDEANPRFVVTSLTRADCKPKYLYEKVYCARGDMENRIKECQLDLYADRTSTATMRANQLRLWLGSLAYILVCAVRRIGLQHTAFSNASCGTIRLKLLKIGAHVRISVRRIKFAMASSCPVTPFGAALPAASMLPRGSAPRPPETCAAAARNNRGIILRPMETTLFVVVVASHKCSLRSRSLTPRASTSPHQLKRDLAQTARLCKVSVRNPG